MSGHLFEDIVVLDSNRALALQARDGGLLQNITFRRIAIQGTRLWPWKWWGDGGPICEFRAALPRPGACAP